MMRNIRSNGILPIPVIVYFTVVVVVIIELCWKDAGSIILNNILTTTITTVDAVPLGFVDEGILMYPSAMSAVIVPNIQTNQPMLLIAKKSGLIDAVIDPMNAPASTTTTTILDIRDLVCTNGPRGIQTIVAHPNFVENPYIYIYYTRYITNCPLDAMTGPSNRLSRFTFNPNTFQIAISSELVLMETPPSTNVIHDGGAMIISPYETNIIYLATGDAGDVSYSQNLQNLWGKLLRLSMDGTTVPKPNPYLTRTGNNENTEAVPCRFTRGVPSQNAPTNVICEEIYAHGLRNPFRMKEQIQRRTNNNNVVLFSICDVGGTAWDEISYGGTEYGGSNYGWPIREGPCIRNSTTICPIASSNDENHFLDPYYYYTHNRTTGAAIVGIVDVPTTTRWPSQYQQLFIDHMEGNIYNLIQESDDQCRTCVPPRPGYRKEHFHSHPRIVDSFFGTYQTNNSSNTQEQQAFYYLSRDEATMNVRRIYYTGSTNAVPQAMITGIQQQELYNIGDTIQFIGDSSTDADNDPLMYLWDLGDGRTSTETNPQVQYTTIGPYTITLTVMDTMNQTDQDSVTITIGSTKPNVEILSPKEGSEFQVLEVLRLQGTGFDYITNSTIVNETQFVWIVRQRHENHFHPFLDERTGNDFNLSPAPKPEDVYASTNSYLEIQLTVYDSYGISNTISRYIYPKKVNIRIESVPIAGLEVFVENIAFTTPTTITTWQNHNLSLNINDQGDNVFTMWSMNGGDLMTTNNELSFLVPPNNIARTITAIFNTDLTKAPMNGPIAFPTIAPSSTPRNAPKTLPTKSPTTKVPKIVPSRAPQKVATKVPTNMPTRSPSSTPAGTKAPTVVPKSRQTTSPRTKGPMPASMTDTPVITSSVAPILTPKIVATKAPRSQPTFTSKPTVPQNNSCTNVTFYLYDSTSNQIVAPLLDRAVVANSPPCNSLNIEAVVSCDRDKISVVAIELYDGTAQLIHRQEERSSPYFLFGNAGMYGRDGRITGGTYKIRAFVNDVLVSPAIRFALGGRCPELPPNCPTDSNVSWNLIDTETDSIVTSIRDKSIIADPPPCHRISIEAILPCPPSMYSYPVYIELRDGTNRLVYEKIERHSRFFLFGNMDDRISNGYIPPGKYMIRAMYNDNNTISPFTTFTLGGRCQELSPVGSLSGK